MNCPVCNDVRMREVEKEGVLIDICPSCKGVWLDRGELDKLMTEVKQERQMYQQSHQQYDSYNQSPHYKHKKKTLFDRLEDIFD